MHLGTTSIYTMVVIGYDRYNVIVKGFSGVKISMAKAVVVLVRRFKPFPFILNLYYHKCEICFKIWRFLLRQFYGHSFLRSCLMKKFSVTLVALKRWCTLILCSYCNGIMYIMCNYIQEPMTLTNFCIV